MTLIGKKGLGTFWDTQSLFCYHINTSRLTHIGYVVLFNNWKGGTPLYYYSNPYSVYPYYHPQRVDTVPVKYVPTHFNEPLQSWNMLRPQSQFPSVDIKQLDVSVYKFQTLMRQADLLIDKLGNDPEFSKELMGAAQQSDRNKVNQLILSTGITIKVKTTFTPTGIRILLDNSELEGGCCDLLIALRW